MWSPAKDAGPLVFVCWKRDPSEEGRDGFNHRILAWLRDRISQSTPFRLWIDEYDIHAGDHWPSTVDDAIESASAALFLAQEECVLSSEVAREMDQILSRNIPLFWLEVQPGADAVIRRWPQLRELQSLVPGISISLIEVGESDYKEQKGFNSQLRRTLIQTSDRLTELLNELHVSTLDQALPKAAETNERGATHKRSQTFDTSSYYRRPEYDYAMKRLLDGRQSGSQGLRIALAGAAGSGKSTLAGQIAGTLAIQSAYPDGVFLVRAGRFGDIYSDLDEIITGASGPASSPPVPPHQGQVWNDAVARLLEQHDMLLIVDDVWERRVIQPLIVPGARADVLFTTRYEALFNQADVELVDLAPLSRSESTLLLQNELRGMSAALFAKNVPPALESAIEMSGGIPIALALIAGLARSGLDWPAIAQRLSDAAEALGPGQLARELRVQQVALDRLREQASTLYDRALDLSALPPDVSCPLSVLQRMWGEETDRTVELLETLRLATVHDAFDSEGRRSTSLRLHDLVSDSIRLLSGETRFRHDRVLDPHRELLTERSRWSTLPSEEHYIWTNLIHHLYGAGRDAEMIETLSSPAWLARRIAFAGTSKIVSECERGLPFRSMLPDIGLPGEALEATIRAIRSRRAELERSHRKLSPDLALQALAVSTPLREWTDAARLAEAASGPVIVLNSVTHMAPAASVAGHSGPVRGLCFGDDEIATCGDDGRLLMWSGSDGKARLLASLDAGTLRDLAWQPNNPSCPIAVACADGSVALIEPDTGSVSRLVGHAGPVRCVAWSPDGRLLASGDDEGVVRVWDSGSRELLSSLEGHSQAVWDVAWSPTSRLASASADGTVIVWDVRSSSRTATLEGHGISARACSWNPISDILAVCAQGGLLQIWNVEEGSLAKSIRQDEVGTFDLQWSPDGNYLATCGNSGQIVVRDAIDLDSVHWSANAHPAAVWKLDWSSDSQRLASASYDGSVKLWSLATGDMARSLKGQSRIQRRVEWKPDRSCVVGACVDGTLQTYLFPSLQVESVRAHSGGALCAAFSPQGGLMASCGMDGHVSIWRLDRMEVLSTAETDWAADAIAWSASGRLVAAGGRTGEVRLWSVDRLTGGLAEAARIPDAHQSEVRALNWHPQEGLLASCSHDGIVAIWSATGDLLARSHVSDDWLRDIRWNADGLKLVIAGDDRRIYVLGKDLELLARLDGHHDWVRSVAWSPNGERLLSCSADDTVRLWDPAGKELAVARIPGGLFACDWASTSGGDAGLCAVATSSELRTFTVI